MYAYRLKTKLSQDNKLILKDLPFKAGEQVEIIILSSPLAQQPANNNLYSLRGKPVEYENPTEPVAFDDWDVLK